jgi:hypothetical protein
MANVSIWSGVGIAIQSALGNAQTVSGVTKANPGVATYVGSDPSNGDYIYLSSVLGMFEIEERVIRVANVNGGGNTLELEGEDTTLYGTFTSGNMQPVTFGTTLAIVTDVNVSGGDFARIDTTTVHDLVRKTIPGAANEIVISGSCIWDPSDAGFKALKSASQLKSKRAVKISFANGYKSVFTGYIGFTGVHTGQAQDKVVTPFEISLFGTPTYYTN